MIELTGSRAKLTRYQALAWLGLALVGQAVALRLIDAGPLIGYQHYRIVGQLRSTDDLIIVLTLLGQMVAVGLGLRRHWSAIRIWLKSNLRIWQILILGIFLTVSGVALSRQVTDYLLELPVGLLIQLTNLGNILLIAIAAPDDLLLKVKRRSCDLLVEAEKGGRVHLDSYALVVAACVVVLAGLLSFFVYQRHPHIPDEVIYLWHARNLAVNQLGVAAPPVPEAFTLYMISTQDAFWVSPFPIGWPAVLSLGVRLGVPWLVNPILAGINILLVYLLVGQLTSRAMARWTVFLLAVSPWYIFMAMNFMAHTVTLTFALIGAAALVRAAQRGSAKWALLAGAATGMVVLTRQMDGIIVAVLLGLWALGVLGGKRMPIPTIVAFVFGTAMVAGMSLPYNRAVTGSYSLDPLTHYYNRYFGPNVFALGFGPDRGLGWELQPLPGHSPLSALINAILNLFSLNTELHGWSTGSLVLVGVLFLGISRQEDRRFAIYLMISILVIAGAYTLFWYNGGPDFGARYWYLMIVPLTLLTVRGTDALADRLELTLGNGMHATLRVHLAVVLLCGLTLANYFPWRALDKYYHYLQMRPDIPALADQFAFGRSLVLIRGNSHPDYASAWVSNPLDFHSAEPIYAWAKDTETERAVSLAFSDRPIWIIEGPTLTGAGFRVIAGPLTSDQLRSMRP